MLNKKMLSYVLLVLLFSCSLVLCLYAESFKILGTRPLSMGGAYVAVGEDAITQYWNPAGLGINKDVDLQIPVAVRAELTGDILGSADRLSELSTQYTKISEAQKAGKSISLDQLSAFAKGIKELNELNDPKKGVIIDVSGGGNIRVGHFAISVNNFTSVGADPNIDIQNLGLGSGSFSPELRRAVSRVTIPEEYSGLDLGDIVDDYNATYQASNPGKNIYDTPSDASVAASATTLAAGFLKDITTELTNLGIDTSITASLPAGLSVEQAIANAIVNAASDPNIAAQLGTTALTPTEISEYVQQIEEVRPLVKTILQSAVAGSSYAKNQSNLTIRGISTYEASLGYGMEAPYVQSTEVLNGFFKGLYVGANLKYMRSDVGYLKVSPLSDDDVDIFDDIDNNKETSNAIGMDLGFLLQKRFFNKKTHFGLLFRNINGPSFDQPLAAQTDGEGSDYELDPQIRGGLAFWPFNWWTLSLDMDITKNDTPLPGYNSRLFGVGNEFNILNKTWLNLALRCGLMKNTAESSAKMAYTVGFGLNLFHFVIDAGAAVSSEWVEIEDGTEVPSSGAGAVTVSFDF
ncbi:MAG: conjugal transfer protein TraF [Elusimicrobia bacterium]|nr:conjugal transfer protein TraF [Elusimicrobiota bacterium]